MICILALVPSVSASSIYNTGIKHDQQMLRTTIDGLAVAGNAPKIFKRTSRSGLPWTALLVSVAFSFLAFMGVTAGSNTVFGWFQNMTSVAGLMTWFGICVTYLRFYKGFKAQGFDRATLPYASKMQPYAAWYGMFSSVIVCFVRAFSSLYPWRS